MLNFETSSESDDEPDIYIRRPRVFRDRNNPFEMYDDINFKLRFQFNKITVRAFVDIIGAELEPATLRNKSVNSMLQILISLRFLATGIFQCVAGDLMGVEKSTAGRIVHRVVHHIALLRPHYIKMPQINAEKRNIMENFFTIAGFPSVIGCIDCTHVRIQSPGGNEAELYRNRKGWFSINVQLVCDAKLKIMNIVARWHGSTHDQTKFNSALRASLERRQFGNGYLLGDNGYACRSYLLTPIMNPRTAAEERYNRAHISTRNTIDRTNGVLKRYFPVLSIGIRVKLQRVFPIIVACAVLHN